MRVVVTGSTGYVGRVVSAELSAAGHTPIPFSGDVRVGSVDGPVDAVVHLAGLGRVRESFADPVRYYDVNVGGTVNLLRSPPPRFVLASTAGVYGSGGVATIDESCPRAPGSPYAASKAAAEDVLAWAAAAGRVRGVALRLFNVAGDGDVDDTRLITRACGVAAGRLPSMEVFGDGSAVRDFVHVRDVARAFVTAVERAGEGYAALNVGATPASVADVLASVARVTGREVAVVRRPAHPGEAPVLRADTTRLRALGWAPTCSDLDTVVRDQWAAERRPGRTEGLRERPRQGEPLQ
ncbi:NAD-dependent epimerase/dehydratase family protein [Saccharothrix luteola]|uniref:NAD-dependent epimerase/dehydratase family protein n=1 Tax=Saccharothrix luteola TaxID=2893018 RepID=UPI001E62BDA8|nr:NAD-dependent epimerase/dehydratase family protein [Saccharothrix luteola]MCC8248246.1 NAD-dependent epimerase/dehydratase family protein [Saccharothrix luteola]